MKTVVQAWRAGHAPRVLKNLWWPLALAISVGGLVAQQTVLTNWVRQFGNGAARSTSWSPDGALIAVAGPDRLDIWNAADATLRQRLLVTHPRETKFSPDGTLLVTLSGDTAATSIELYRVSDWTLARALPAKLRNPVFMEISPDNSRLLVGEDFAHNSIKLLDANSGALIRAHNYGAACAAFSPDGSLIALAVNIVSAGPYSRVSLQRAADGVVVAFLARHSNTVNSVRFSADAKYLVSGSSDQTAIVWTLGSPAGVHRVLRGHTNAVTDAAFSPAGEQVLTVSWDKTAMLWRASNGAVERVLTGHTDRLSSAGFAPDGSRLLTHAANEIRLWRAGDGAFERGIGEYSSPVLAVALAPAGDLLATGHTDGTVTLLRLSDGTVVRRLAGHTDWTAAVAFTPDGTHLFTGSYDRTARLWRIADGTVRLTLTGHTRGISSVAVSPDGTVAATTAWDRTVRLWRMADGLPVTTVQESSDLINAVAFSPDGARLATGGEAGRLKLRDPRTGALQRDILLPGPVTSLAFTPDGLQVAVAGGLPYFEGPVTVPPPANASLVSLAPGPATILHLTQSDAPFRAFRMLPGNFWLATMGASVQLARGFGSFHSLRGHSSTVNSLAASRNGELVVTGSDDGTALLWDVTSIIPPSVHLSLRDGKARVSWLGGGKLEAADSVSGPFLPVDTQTNVWETPPVSNRFFRVVR